MRQHFKFNPSVRLAILLCLAHGALLVVLPLLALPGWGGALLAAVVVASLAYHLWRDAWLRAPDSCRELMLEGGDAVLTLRNGKRLRGAIARGSLVTPYLAVLNVSLPGWRGMRGVVILPDSLDNEAFRQLRVQLRWGGQERP